MLLAPPRDRVPPRRRLESANSEPEPGSTCLTGRTQRGLLSPIVGVDIETYFATLSRTPNVQAGLAGWFGGLLAADMFETLNCHFVRNWARFCDPRFDGNVKRLAAEQANDPAVGVALAARLDREIVDRAPWVPLFTPRFANFTSERVGNYQTSTYAANSVLLDQLWVR